VLPETAFFNESKKPIVELPIIVNSYIF
jgi:hypothetical protein